MNFKKYSHHAGNLLLWMATFATLGLCCPATLKNIEAQNPLLGAGDFISESLRYPGGLVSIANTWLQQFYVYPWLGAALTATLITACSLSIGVALRSLKTRWAALVGLILASVILFVEFPNQLTLLQITLSLLLYAGYAALKTRNRSAGLAIACLLVFPVLGSAAAFGLYLAFLLTDLAESRRVGSWIYSAVGLFLSILFPYLWSEGISYLDENQRQLFRMDALSFVLPLLPIIHLFSKSKANTTDIKHPAVEWGCHLAAALIIPALFLIQKGKIAQKEDLYHMEQAAEEGDWSTVYQLANANRPNYTDLQLRYALLAESEAGTLADNLFFYPVTSTDNFYFNRKTEVIPAFFNALFYKSVGVGDEYMHQIFEMGVQNHASASARTIRHLTEAAIMQGDKALARKYFDIACRSQKEQQWTERTAQKLNELNSTQVTKDSVPDRSGYFIGSYAPKLEFTYMALDDSTNTKRINLMLCSFLLEKDMGRFKQALSMYRELFRQHLPNAYAEAYLLANMDDRNYVLPFDVPQNKMQDWMNYLQLLSEDRIGEINQQYSNTYWYYYLYSNAQAAKQQ